MSYVKIPMRTLLVLAMVAAGAASAAGAPSPMSKDVKLCENLDEFRASLNKLDQLGPEATVKELSDTENQVEEKGRAIVSESKHDKHAKNLNAAINDLDAAVSRIPADSTIASAESSIENEVDAVTAAAKSFRQSYCPAGK